MKILFASYEAAPFFKVGGLGDVAGSLPLALAKIGVEVVLVLPGYDFLKLKARPAIIGEFGLVFNQKEEKVKLGLLHIAPRVSLCVLYHPFLSKFETVKDKVFEYAFFSKAIKTLIMLRADKRFGQFDLVHIHDWHTAAVAYFLKNLDKKSRIPSILTIHNLMYQGGIAKEKLSGLIGSEISDPLYLNLMELGIKYADYITTVSPTYAKEIIKTRRGLNLRKFLQEKRSKISGILNGIDCQKWDPQTDIFIEKKFNIKTVDEGKQFNKIHLQKELALKEFQVPLVSFIGRLEPKQKGIDLICEMLNQMGKASNFQMVILGTGHHTWAKRIGHYVKNNQGHFAFINRFDEKISHQVYAASDIILIPSKFEPCGLVQMIAMRYGTLPLVRETGGLADTVKDGVNGFSFKPYSASALTRTLRMALKMFQEQPEKISQMRERAMKEDFSWDKSAREYKRLYERVIKTVTSG